MSRDGAQLSPNACWVGVKGLPPHSVEGAGSAPDTCSASSHVQGPAHSSQQGPLAGPSGHAGQRQEWETAGCAGAQASWAWPISRFHTSSPSSVAGATLDPYSTCNRNCECQTDSFTPVCGADGVTYLSACFAGCTSTVRSRGRAGSAMGGHGHAAAAALCWPVHGAGAPVLDRCCPE